MLMGITQTPYGFKMKNTKHCFTSDTHYGHYNIIEYSSRPFSSVEEMDAHLIEQTNLTVDVDDTLWHVGDFSMYHHNNHTKYYEKCKRYRDQIKCRNVNIIWGNHDDYSIRDLFNEAYDYKELRLKGEPMIVMCHYAFAVWNKSHRGSINLYGHSHSSAEHWMDTHLSGRRSIDIGVDNAFKILKAYRPWTLDEIKNIMNKKKGVSIDHHESNTESIGGVTRRK